MADYLDFPDILTRLPIWAILAASLFVTALAIKMAMRSLKIMLVVGMCAATIYLLLSLT